MLRPVSTLCSFGSSTCATLAELMASSKKMRTTDGVVVTVEPSTGSEPITKACANATGGCDGRNNQVDARKTLRLNAITSSGLRDRCSRIFPLCTEYHTTRQIVH